MKQLELRSIVIFFRKFFFNLHHLRNRNLVISVIKSVQYPEHMSQFRALTIFVHFGTWGMFKISLITSLSNFTSFWVLDLVS